MLLVRIVMPLGQHEEVASLVPTLPGLLSERDLDARRAGLDVEPFQPAHGERCLVGPGRQGKIIGCRGEQSARARHDVDPQQHLAGPFALPHFLQRSQPIQRQGAGQLLVGGDGEQVMLRQRDRILRAEMDFAEPFSRVHVPDMEEIIGPCIVEPDQQRPHIAEEDQVFAGGARHEVGDRDRVAKLAGREVPDEEGIDDARPLVVFDSLGRRLGDHRLTVGRDVEPIAGAVERDRGLAALGDAGKGGVAALARLEDQQRFRPLAAPPFANFQPGNLAKRVRFVEKQREGFVVVEGIVQHDKRAAGRELHAPMRGTVFHRRALRLTGGDIEDAKFRVDRGCWRRNGSQASAVG